MKLKPSYPVHIPFTFALLALNSGFFLSHSHGAIGITDSGSYSQDFNTLPNTGESNTVHPWLNNITLPGWYIDAQTAGGAVTEIRTGPHSSNATSIHVYSYGYPLNDPDRSLGSVQTNTSGTNAYAFGLLFQNNSGYDVTFETMSFRGEQYRFSGAAANSNTAWYQISTEPITSPSISSEGWTALPELDFTSPAYNTNNPDGLASGDRPDGNAANYHTFLSTDLDITLAADEYIMFRFLDPDYPGTDHALGYDDLFVSWTTMPPALPQVEQPPVIDGQIDLIWNADQYYPITRINQGTPASPENLSAAWSGLYDDTYLYILVRITDDVLVWDSTLPPHHNDRIEINFNMDNMKPGGGNGREGDNYQYSFNYSETQVVAGPNASLNGVLAASVDTADGWVLEIAFPWQTLGNSPDSFGFDIAINDNDDLLTTGLDRVIYWYNTGTPLWTNIDGAGTISKGLLFDGNYAPVIEPLEIQNVNEGATLTVVAEAFDANSEDNIILTASALPSFASFTDNGDGTAAIAVSPEQGDANIYFMTVTASDGRRQTDCDIVLIVRDPAVPEQSPALETVADVTVQQGTLLTIPVQASDKDSLLLSITSDDLPPFVSVEDHHNKTATVYINPTFDHLGDYTITLTASDGGLTANTAFTVTVVEPIVKLTEFHIDPVNGSDANDGSAEAPWKTLQTAMSSGSLFEAGDRIYLYNGYHGEPTLSSANNNGKVYILPKKGHQPQLSRLTFSALSSNWYVRDLIISRSFAPTYTPLQMVNIAGSNNVLDGCTIYTVEDSSEWSANDWAAKHANGISINGNHNVARNNRIFNTQYAINLGGSNNSVLYNTIRYFSGDGVRALGSYNRVEGNLITDNINIDDHHDDGIQSWSTGPGGVATGVIRGNVLLNNIIIQTTDRTRPFQGSLQGIGLFDGFFEDWIIENNMVITDHFHGITLYGGRNCRINGNTVIYDRIQAGVLPRTWISLGHHEKYATAPLEEKALWASTGNTIRNNLMTSDASTKAGNTFENNSVIQTLEAMQDCFVNYPYDLRLRPDSPAIDAGAPEETLLFDIDGNVRPADGTAGWDMGASEYTVWGASWFGYLHSPIVPITSFEQYYTTARWSLHLGFGWIYTIRTSPDPTRIWFWSVISGEWFWTGEDTYPWLFSFELDTWILHNDDTAE